MTVVPITTKEAIAKQVQSLIEKGVPGNTKQSKIEFLLDSYPHLKPKDIAEILNIKTAYVYTAKHTMLKNRKSEVQPAINVSAPIEEEYKADYNEVIPPDLWDYERYDYAIDPPIMPMQSQQPRMAAPASLSATTSTELNLVSVDGMTLKLLMNVIYGNIDDNRKYKAYIKIEE